MHSEEVFEFQAEINQLLSLIINTFYSNKDVCIRELISNASDALDKARHISLTNGNIQNEKYEIRIKCNPENKSVIIEDSGIGMSKDDLINNLGTIAKSGTKSFMEALKNNDTNISLIGQFGVGFYSAYLIAQKVTVYTRKYDSNEGFVWESQAGGTFSITPWESDFEQGTRIVLHLKDDQTEFSNPDKIKEIIKKHSEFITYPIYIEKEVNVPVEKDQSDDKEEEDEEVADVSDKPETEMIKKLEWEQINVQKPIWIRKPDEVTNDDYASFYKTLTNDWDTHLAVKHFSAEGQLEFRSILYIPKRVPFDLFHSHSKQNNVKLYVRRIFITDDAEELIPPYLSFIKGVVDSEDLPLNVSREMLQQNKIIKVIKKSLVKHSIEMISELANKDDPTDWNLFYKNYSKHLKLGIHEDQKNREKLTELLRFTSTYSLKSIEYENKEKMTSLSDYVSRMKPDQESIYFITGESIKAIEKNPMVETVTNRGYEVLLMTDPIDEYVMQQLNEYKDKKFVCISKAVNLFKDSEDEKKKKEDIDNKYKDFCTKVLEILGERVSKVEAMNNLVSDVPSVIVTDQYGWTANMERIMKAQALRDSSTIPMMSSRKILQINVNSKIINVLYDQFQSNPDKLNKNTIHLMFEAALLSCGFGLPDPVEFASRLYNVMNYGLSIESDLETELVSETEQSPTEKTIMEEVD